MDRILRIGLTTFIIMAVLTLINGRVISWPDWLLNFGMVWAIAVMVSSVLKR